MSLIICFSGKIASGKTYISNKIAQSFNGTKHSTSEYLRHKLNINNVTNPSREQLQAQGALELNKGMDIFAKSFLDYISAENTQNLIIIDGVRHLEFYNAIRQLVGPNNCLLIFIEVSEEIILQRLTERGETVIDYAHIAEGNLLELQSFSDYVSKGNVENIENYISNWLFRIANI